MEADKQIPDLFGLAQVELGIGDRAVLEAQQGGELLHVQFLHANLHVLRQHKFDEGLALGIEAGARSPSEKQFSYFDELVREDSK